MAEAELALINKVELRIALAADDTQFEQSLKLYLAPLLLKLASPYPEARKAVLNIVQYLIPRFTAARSIKLPIEALLDQVKTPRIPHDANPSTVRLYSLLFVSRGVDRLSDDEKRLLVPKVIENISKYPSSVSSRLFNILTRLLVTWKAPARDSAEYPQMAAFLTFDKNPDDERFLAINISKFLMMQPNGTPNPAQSPGLSVEDSSFFTHDAGVTYKSAQEIFMVKKHLLEFLKTGFRDANLSIPLIIASVDSSSAIKDDCEAWLKKLPVDTEDPVLVRILISLFVGSSDNSVPPAKSTLQEKILSVLLRSKEAAKSPDIAKITTLGLGSDYGRLKQTTVQFIKWISNQENTDSQAAGRVVKDFNVSMVQQLKDSLMGEGWPQMDTAGIKNYSSSINQRALQYEALGNILRANPDLFTADLGLVEFLFDSLEGEVIDLRPTLQEILSALTVHLPNLTAEAAAKLKSIAKKYLVRDNLDSNPNLHSCRFVAIKYVNCAFSFADPEARFLCILGTSKKNRADTIEESIKGLHPHWISILQASNTLEFKSTTELLGGGADTQFPSFSSMVATLAAELKEGTRIKDASVFKCLARGIEFTLQTLVMQAIQGNTTVVVADEEWLVRLEKALEVDKQVQGLLVFEINKIANEDVEMDGDGLSLNTNPLREFLSVIFEAFVGQYTDGVRIPSDITFGSTLTRLLSLSPPPIIGSLFSRVGYLLELLNSKLLGDIASSQVCQSIGIIGSHPTFSDEQIRELMAKLTSEETPAHLLKGRLLASAYLISHLTLRRRLSTIPPDTLKKYVELLLRAIKDTRTYQFSLQAVSQLAIFGTLGPIINIYDGVSEHARELVRAIEPHVKKLDEPSVIAYAHLSLAFEEKTTSDGTYEFEKAVYDTHVSKQIEYVFTSGEALLIIAGGWESNVLQRSRDTQGETVEYIPSDVTRVPFVLDMVLESCANTKPSLRRAGCIWLLSLVQYLGHLDAIQNKAAAIHVAFMKFLADRDELIQESASRGLSLVYEMGDYDLKDTLVRGLLKSFTDSNASSALSAGSVDLETQLFEPDLLKTNDGSVSTYKDVLSLASDVGDPSLVYKFMSLAKSSALWSSRKGMAFGLGSILSKSSLDEMLSTNKNLSDRLIPKLYRYKFDPSSSVSKSMTDIWNALIKDTPKTVKDNFEAILKELLKSMGNKEWRTREASTTALNELLQSVPLSVYEEKLEDIWNMSFRAMDDIKESVRKEGVKLTKGLATTLTRTADVKNGNATIEKAGEVLSKLVPFLLGSKGLLSDAEEIKAFALETILKLCKIGGLAIVPFIPVLLDNFISMMSTLEPEVVNYLVLNADKYNLKNNDIDAKRLQSLGHSPMMDAIEKLLDILDESLMPETVRVLQSSIKKSVGLPSKVCGSRVLVSLVVKHYDISKPYGDKLLKIAINQTGDKNDTIASSYATAAGYLCRIASLDSVVAYSKHINDLYFNSEDERNRELAATASESVSKYCGSDNFEKVASAFLPLAYLGKHDSVKSVRIIFEREWIENASGTSAIKLYLEEICNFAEIHLLSNQYLVRQTVAKSIADLCNNLDSSPPKIFQKLFFILIEACKGKSWLGKEHILQALVSFAIKSESFLSENNELVEKLNKVVMTEAKRRNVEYQKHSIKLLGKFVGRFYDDELMETYIEIMTNSILSDEYYDEELDNDTMEDVRDSKNTSVHKSNQLNIKVEEERLSFMKNLFETLSLVSTESEPNQVELLEVSLNSIIRYFGFNKFEKSWRSKVELGECFKMLFTKFEKAKSLSFLTKSHIGLVLEIWNLMNENHLNSNNIERVKIETIRNAKPLIALLEDLHYGEDASTIKKQLSEFRETELSTVVRNELDGLLQN